MKNAWSTYCPMWKVLEMLHMQLKKNGAKQSVLKEKTKQLVDKRKVF